MTESYSTTVEGLARCLWQITYGSNDSVAEHMASTDNHNLTIAGGNGRGGREEIVPRIEGDTKRRRLSIVIPC